LKYDDDNDAKDHPFMKHKIPFGPVTNEKYVGIKEIAFPE